METPPIDPKQKTCVELFTTVGSTNVQANTSTGLTIFMFAEQIANHIAGVLTWPFLGDSNITS